MLTVQCRATCNEKSRIEDESFTLNRIVLHHLDEVNYQGLFKCPICEQINVIQLSPWKFDSLLLDGLDYQDIDVTLDKVSGVG